MLELDFQARCPTPKPAAIATTTSSTAARITRPWPPFVGGTGGCPAGPPQCAAGGYGQFGAPPEP